MQRFIELFETLDNTTRSALKEDALVDYFTHAKSFDAAWALFFLIGKRLHKVVPLKVMKEVTYRFKNIPEWLFKACYDHVGDLSETISLMVGKPSKPLFKGSLTDFVEAHIIDLQQAENKEEVLLKSYGELSQIEIFLMNKFITGQFRVGVSKGLVLKSLSKATQLDKTLLGQRLLGNWQPSESFYKKLVAYPTFEEDHLIAAKPFMLAHPLTEDLQTLGDLSHWQIEWKWDGIRAQLIIQKDNIQLWSRGEELINESFPEIITAAQELEFLGVLDGEILAYHNGVLSFQQLQKRINRKSVTQKLIKDIPCVFYAFDVLHGDKDLRQEPIKNRRLILEKSLQSSKLIKPCEIIKEIDISKLSALQRKSRQFKAEGFMLKHKDSPYVMGRKTGLWWKWKVKPMTLDAVLIQAQRGHGRRAGIYSDYTFALWHNDKLVTFAKAYSGLTDVEMAEVNKFVKQNTIEQFGPVAVVNPELVFEIAFENIQISKRHKSGIAVRFPRILRSRKDKKPCQANTLDDLKALLKLYE